jgi:hypothetical protein
MSTDALIETAIRRKVVMKKTLILFFLFTLPLTGYAQDNGLSVGYGFGFLNHHRNSGKIEFGRDYDFAQISYFREFHLIKDLFFHLEPFLAYVNQPNNRVDMGLNLLLRYYVNLGKNSLFMNAGSGALIRASPLKNKANMPSLFFKVVSGINGGIFLYAYPVDTEFVVFKHFQHLPLYG